MIKKTLLVVLIFGLIIIAAACSRGKGLSKHGVAHVPGFPAGESGGAIELEDSVPEALNDVLKAIIEAERDYDPSTRERRTSALPVTLLGDEEWMKGATPSNFEKNTDEHWLKIKGLSLNVENDTYFGFAVYRFTGLLGENMLAASSFVDIDVLKNFYFYVVDFSGMPKWRQYGPYGEKPGSMPPGGYEYPVNFGFNAISSNGNVYIAFGVYGLHEAKITSISLDEGTPLEPPVAVLSASPLIGDIPLMVNFNASQSYDPDGSPLTFEWDFDGDGVYDQFTGMNPFAQHTYTTDGVYVAKVRVRDLDDDVGVAFVLINAGDLGYYETEPNDVFSLANVLPQFDFPDPVVLGSLGQDIDAGYGGYDGDYIDNFRFENTEVSSVTLRIAFNNSTCDLSAELYDAFEVAVGEYYYESGDAVIEADLTRLAEYFLKITATEGYTDYTISAKLIPGSRPVAEIIADNTLGLPPLTVNFDGSGSFDPDGGDIVKYEWDFDGDGIYDLDSDTDPYVEHIYETPGTFNATLRVTNGVGAKGRDSIEITVREPFFEVEDNDTPAQANQLPVFDFPPPAVTGSIGAGFGYEAYDGDNVDWFTFSTTQMGVVQLTLEYTSFNGIFLSLYDSDIELIAESIDGDGFEYIQAQLPGAGTYYVLVDTISGFSDYELTGRFAPGSLPVAKVSANPRFGNLPLTVDFDASASFDPDGGAIAKYEWDFDGDGVFDLDTGSTPTAQHLYTETGSYQAMVRVTDNEDTWAEAVIAIVAGNPVYFEVEPNNSFAQANVWPLFPFPGPAVNGNVGFGGYDGGLEDFFKFETAQAGTPEIILTYNRFAGQVSLELYNSDFDLVAESSVGNGLEVINEDFPADVYYVKVSRVGSGVGDVDYSIEGRFAPGQKPEADISADVESGDPPLTVNFDASGSFDPDGGSIVLYEWDLDGDGTYEQNTGSNPDASHDYNSSGVYRATVRVTDNEGARDTAFVFIFVATEYYELEDNDSFAQANALPDLPFPSPTVNGNLGYSGSNDYDGDSEDYFSFEVVSTSLVGITLTFQGSNCNIDLELFDDAMEFITGSYGTGDSESISTVLDEGTYYIRLFVGDFDPGGTGASDYEIVISTA